MAMCLSLIHSHLIGGEAGLEGRRNMPKVTLPLVMIWR